LVGVFTVIGVESYTAVESILRSVASVSVPFPVYITTVSHFRFAIASQAVTVAEAFNIAAMISGLCGSAVVICLIAVLFLYVRRISKVSEMELGAACAIKPDLIETRKSRL
jgi:nitrate reductase gamma subunit